MKLRNRLKICIALSSSIPLAALFWAHGDLSEPRFGQAAALGLAAALLISLLGSGAMSRWLFGGGLKRIAAICVDVKRGEYGRIPSLPTQNGEADENEFVETMRSLSWMAHRIRRREEELRDTIDELRRAKVRLEKQGRALRDANCRLSCMAKTDPLTGISNRRHFFERLERQIAMSDKPVSLLILDIDHFKTINDSKGHQAGDSVLKELSGRLRLAVRKTDMVARVGGEEFAVMLSGVGPESAESIAKAVHEAVRDRVFDGPCGETGLRVTCSVGVCAVPGGSARPSLEEAYRLADEALYEAKRSGRDRVCLRLVPAENAAAVDHAS